MINNNNINPFDKISGSASLGNPKGIILLFAAVALFALILGKLEIVGVGLLFALMFGSVYLYILFKNPIIGFYTAIGLNFLLLGLGCYVMGLPLGSGIDGIIILTFLAIILYLSFCSTNRLLYLYLSVIDLLSFLFYMQPNPFFVFSLL